MSFAVLLVSVSIGLWCLGEKLVKRFGWIQPSDIGDE